MEQLVKTILSETIVIRRLGDSIDTNIAVIAVIPIQVLQSFKYFKITLLCSLFVYQKKILACPISVHNLYFVQKVVPPIVPFFIENLLAPLFMRKFIVA